MTPDSSKVGVLITTIADNAGIVSTEAGLAAVGDAAEKTQKKATSAFDAFNSSLSKVGTQMTAVGKDMSTYVTLPIVALAGASVKMAMDFQQSMTYVKTDAGDTTDNINTLSTSVLNLAKTSQFSPDVLANGLYHLASLGLRGSDALNALNTAQQMAAVGGADLESTATALGGALVSGISGVQNYTQAAGVLDATVGAGNMRMQDLVDAIGTGVLPVFKNAGLSITDFGAALATLTDNGQDAAAAATHLRMTVSLMEAPSQAAAGAMEKIGLTSNQLGLDMQTKGLVPALEDLQKHLTDTYGTTAEGKTAMAAALSEMFGGGKSSAAIQTLLDELDRVQNKETQIGQQSGEFSTKYAEQQKTVSAQFKTAWDAVQASLIQLGDTIMPSVANAAKSAAKIIGELSDWFQSLSKGQKQFIIDAAGIIAIMGPLLVIFGTFAKSISNILSLGKTIAPVFVGAFNLVSSGVTGLAGVVGTAGIAMSAVFVGVAADIGLVYEAIKSVTGALNAWNNTYNASVQAETSQQGAIASIKASFAAGKITQAQEAQYIAAQNRAPSANATGTSYAPGGMSLVGEQGPELVNLPSGSQVYPARQSASMMNSTNNNQTITIGQVILSTPQAASAFLGHVDRDAQLQSMGLSPARGLS